MTLFSTTPYGKMILSIPIISESEAQYKKKRNKRLAKNLQMIPSGKGHDEVEAMMRDSFNGTDPYAYPYDSIIGFVNIAIDYNEVLLFFVLNGDRKRKYSRHQRYHIGPRKFHLPVKHAGAGIFEWTNAGIQQGILKALDEVEIRCKEWKVCIQNDFYCKLISVTDYMTLLNIDPSTQEFPGRVLIDTGDEQLHLGKGD